MAVSMPFSHLDCLSGESPVSMVGEIHESAPATHISVTSPPTLSSSDQHLGSPCPTARPLTELYWAFLKLCSARCLCIHTRLVHLSRLWLPEQGARADRMNDPKSLSWGHVQDWSLSSLCYLGWMLSLFFLTFTFYIVTAIFTS